MKIRIENLVKKYKGKTALAGLTLGVNEGEVYGFIGPNGAGKTTTMSVLAGLIRYDSGVCEIDGQPSGMARIGYLPEEPAFAEYLSGGEYLSMLARSMGMTSPGRASGELLKKVGLSAVSERRVSGYSRGMRQRLGLACALLGDPSLLVLDEPSSALDPEGRKAVVDLVLELKAEGKTVFLSTHILSDIERICDRIGLIDSGKLMLEGPMPGLLDEGVSRKEEVLLSRPLAEAEKQALSGLPFVERIDHVQGSSSFTVHGRPGDRDRARIELARKMAELSLPLVSLNPAKASLEELFLGKVARHE